MTKIGGMLAPANGTPPASGVDLLQQYGPQLDAWEAWLQANPYIPRVGLVAATDGQQTDEPSEERGGLHSNAGSSAFLAASSPAAAAEKPLLEAPLAIAIFATTWPSDAALPPPALRNSVVVPRLDLRFLDLRKQGCYAHNLRDSECGSSSEEDESDAESDAEDLGLLSSAAGPRAGSSSSSGGVIPALGGLPPLLRRVWHPSKAALACPPEAASLLGARAKPRNQRRGFVGACLRCLVPPCLRSCFGV